jgi:hypothetical protein
MDETRGIVKARRPCGVEALRLLDAVAIVFRHRRRLLLVS